MLFRSRSLVPGHDHFGVIIAVAPQGVGVQVAFVPLLGTQRAGDPEEGAEQQEVFHDSGLLNSNA